MDERQPGMDDDEFGLPEVRLRPRHAGQDAAGQVPGSQEPPGQTNSPTEPNEISGDRPLKEVNPVPESAPAESSGISRLLYILIPLLTVLLALKGYFYFHIAPAKIPQATEIPEKTVPKAEPDVSKVTAEPPVKVEKTAAAVTEILSAPTGRFHVVIKSSLDKESIMNEAVQLNAKGIGCLVIPSGPTSPSNRLVLFSTETITEAQSRADSLRPSFGAGIWVLKY